MLQIEKEDLISKVLTKQLGGFVSWSMPVVPPLLGPKYIEKAEALRKEARSFAERHKQLLDLQDDSNLISAYGTTGDTQDHELETHWREARQNSPVCPNCSVIYLAALGKPGVFADYDYWSRMEWMELKEAFWLCLGLDPRVDWEDVLTYSTSRRPGHPKESKHVHAQLKQLSRFAMRVAPVDRKFRGPELLEWVDTTGFPVHPDFVQMLRVRQKRENTNEPTTAIDPLPIKQKKEDPRAVRAVARIIVAIAIEEYGYDPNSVRSPIPKEIVDIMDRLGLQATSETVLKYLKMGASELPDGWDAGRN